MSAKQKIVHGCWHSHINFGIFVCSFDVCRASKPVPLLTMTNFTSYSTWIFSKPFRQNTSIACWTSKGHNPLTPPQNLLALCYWTDLSLTLLCRPVTVPYMISSLCLSCLCLLIGWFVGGSVNVPWNWNFKVIAEFLSNIVFPFPLPASISRPHTHPWGVRRMTMISITESWAINSSAIACLQKINWI